MIDIRICEMGGDRVFLVTGGTAHIGATAMAYAGTEGGIRAEALAVPGHRERELAEELALQAASALGCTVTVAVGIHLDEPDRQQIADAVEEARAKMREVLRQARATGQAADGQRGSG